MKNLLGSAAVFLALTCLPQHAAYAQSGTEPERPNIIFIMFDDLGYGSLGAYGSELIQTANIDDFATEAMRFTQYYANAAVCSPTRAAILSGQYPQSFNIRSVLGVGRRNSSDGRFSKVGLPGYIRTLPEMLQNEGYKTVHLGKWHIGRQKPEFEPVAAGFDEYAIRIPHLSGYAEDAYFFETIELTDGSLEDTDGQHLTEWLIDHAIEFLETDTSQPFFLNIWLRAPHKPLNAPQHWLDAYPANLDGKYSALVSWADEQIGRLLDTLDVEGLRDDTIVFITSDNGARGQHTDQLNANGGYLGKKGQLHEGGIRVPFLVRWPGQIPAGTSDFPVASFDLYPTLADLLEADVSGDNLGGESILEVLLDEPGAATERQGTIFWEGGNGERLAVRDGRWKMHIWGQTHLYDMESPACNVPETCEADENNLWVSDPATAVPIVTALTQDYYDWRQETTEIGWQVLSTLGDVTVGGDAMTFSEGGGKVTLCGPDGTPCEAGGERDDVLFDFHDGSFTFSLEVTPDPGLGTLASIAGKTGSWRLWYWPDGRVKLKLFGDGCSDEHIPEKGCDTEAVLETAMLPSGAPSRVTFTVLSGGLGNVDYQTVRLYLDGVLQEESSASTSSNRVLDVVSNTKRLELGSKGNLAAPFLGTLNGLRLFTASLSAEELQRLGL